MNTVDAGRRVSELRKKRGMTLTQLSSLTGLSPGQISRLENGKQGFRSATLLKVARALQIEPWEIYQDETPAPQPPELSRKLLRALRHPEAVSVLEQIARARTESPGAYRAIRQLLQALAGP